MVEGTADTDGGIVVRQGDSYAIPAPVADRMGAFMVHRPEHV